MYRSSARNRKRSKLSFLGLTLVFQKIFKHKVFRYLVCGVLSTVFNILVLAIIIELLNAKTPMMRNIANIIAIEISLLFSFFIYKRWVWRIGRSTIKEAIFWQLARYHMSVSAAIFSRTFMIFPLLDWLKVHYSINTLIGIALGSTMTYNMTDRWVFKLK